MMIVKKFTLDNINYVDDLALCLGFFNGLHIGHLRLIEKSLNLPLKSAVLTFSDTFYPIVLHQKEKVITSSEDQKEILERLGVDYLLILRFDEKVMRLSKEDFIEKILVKLGSKKLICGFDYSFGHKASGTIADLINLAHDRYEVEVVDKIDFYHQKAATTTAIKLIEEGKVDLVNELLTRPYQITGKVVQGKRNGHLLGFPTANVLPKYAYVMPKNGVYAAKVVIAEKEYMAMVNVGIHPTIDALEEKIIEAHLLDFNDDDLYNQEIKVKFYHHLREEIKFDSSKELVCMLKRNEQEVREYFKNINIK